MDLTRVGLRLRELREAPGLPLSELARRSSIGQGTLSELESGRVSGFATVAAAVSDRFDHLPFEDGPQIYA